MSQTSSQRSKRQLQANGSGNRLTAADGNSKARFGSGLVSLGGAPKVCARHRSPAVAARTSTARVFTPTLYTEQDNNCWRQTRSTSSREPAIATKGVVGKSLYIPCTSSLQEHAGNDPNAQLVAQGWNSKQPERPPALSTNSHWASSSGRASEGQHADARFSNADYPSLQAAARSASASNTSQGARIDRQWASARTWEDDERGGPLRSQYVLFSSCV